VNIRPDRPEVALAILSIAWLGLGGCALFLAVRGGLAADPAWKDLLSLAYVLPALGLWLAWTGRYALRAAAEMGVPRWVVAVFWIGTAAALALRALSAGEGR
jgi:hypothetical protein